MQPDERDQPRRGGRPEIGPAFSLRFPTALLAAVDARARAEGLTRAELIRRIVTDAITRTPRH